MKLFPRNTTFYYWILRAKYLEIKQNAYIFSSRYYWNILFIT